jgi:oligopeptidase B
MAKGHDYFALGSWSISDDNKLLTYSVDTVSRRIYTMKVKNLETGQEYSEAISHTSGSAVWVNDNEHFYYTIQDETTLRDHKVMLHKLGDNPINDKLIFEEKDEEFTTGVGKSKSNKYIFIESDQSITSEVRFADADNPNAEFQVILPRKKGHEYSVEQFKDEFIIHTNDNAQNFKLVGIKIGENSLENAREIIPHRENVLLEDIEIFNDYLALEERENALNKIRVINLKTEDSKFIEMNDPAYNCWIGINNELESTKLRYGYTSLTTPFSTFEYDMETRESTLLKEKEILGDFDKNNYKSERIWATARDGKKVPVSIVYRKGFEKNGESPLLLYGYGSYGITIDPVFTSDRLSLLDRGFGFAIAHIRGGEDLGRAWYEDGKMLNKKNTFTDFIDVADFLLAENYTSKDKLFAYGGSAGGLLMGAVTNMRPELWKGVISAVPFVDVVTTMLDESIPLTTGEYDEWGNPNEKEYFDYMLSYSPYDQVSEMNYPNMLITTGYHDSQVQYWEPLKWTAKLRDFNKSDNYIYLNVIMEAGHGGASGRFKKYKETALKYAFMLDLLGIKE